MIPSFNIRAGESPAAVSERRKIAMALMKEGMDTSPIRSPWQGAARVAQAMMGGMELNRADQIEKDKEAKKDAGFLAAAGIGMAPSMSASAAPAAAPVPPMPNGVSRVAAALSSPQSAPVKDVYDANEQSPLDPVPGAITPDRARLLAALQPGESGGRPNVMYGGKTFDSYADHPRVANPIMSGPNAGKTSSAAGTYQFIAPTWDRAQKALNLPDFSPGNQNAAAAHIAGEDYQKRTGQNLDAALSQAGQDPAKIAAIGKALSPTWTSLPGGIEPNQQTNQFVRNMQAPATEFSAQARQQSVAQQQPAAALDPARNTPQIPQAVQDRIRLLVQSGNRDLALAEYQKYTTPSQSQLVQIDRPDGSGIKDPFLFDAATGKFTRAELPGQGQVSVSPTSGQPSPVPGNNQPPAAAPPAAQKGIPPAPPGVNVAAWNKVHTEALAEASTGKLTESQGKATQFANRMETAENQIGPVEHEGSSASQRAWAAADSSLGAAGFGIPRGQLTDGYKTFDTARGQWITALLRRESGAAISPQEFTRYDREFFPQPNDGPNQIALKREARRVAIDAMKKEAGGSYQSPQVASRGGPQIGAVEDGYRFKGGNPADQASWERVQ